MPSGSFLSVGYSSPLMLAFRGGGDKKKVEHVIQNPGTEHGWRRFARFLWYRSGLVCRFSVHALGRRRPMFRRSEDLAADSSGIGFRSIPFGRFHFRKGDVAPSGRLRSMFHDSSALVALYRAIEQSPLAGGCFPDGLGGGARRPGHGP